MKSAFSSICHLLIVGALVLAAAPNVLGQQIAPSDFMKGLSNAWTPEQVAVELKTTAFNLTVRVIADLNSYPKIRDKLELVDSQIDEMKKLLREQGDRHEARKKEFFVDGVILEDRLQEYCREAEQDSDRLREGIRHILLPHQAELLDQLTKRVAFEKVVASLNGQQQLPGLKRKQKLWPEDLSRSLGLRPSEIETLTSEVPKIEAELDAKVADLRSEALRKIIALLPVEKRSLVEDAILAQIDPELLDELRSQN